MADLAPNVCVDLPSLVIHNHAVAEPGSQSGMTIDRTEDECKALINLITVEIQSSHYPLSPRIEGQAHRRCR